MHSVNDTDNPHTRRIAATRVRTSFSQMNPEYDYAMFTDEDCARFMCKFADPDTLRAYEVSIIHYVRTSCTAKS